MIKYLLLSLTVIFCLIGCSNINSQELVFNPIEKKLDSIITEKLINKGYEKVTCYYDTKNKKDGLWVLFPWAKISNDLVLINVNKIPNNNISYNYLINYSLQKEKVIKISEPFYDRFFSKIILEKDRNLYLLYVHTLVEGDDYEVEKFVITFF